MTEKVYPGERAKISVIFKINEENYDQYENRGNKIIEIKFSLAHPEEGYFGEPLRAYCEIDPVQFHQNQALLSQQSYGLDKCPDEDSTAVWMD
ncbi:unnamed protein product [Moneuplotes crassus]|uniref:Uncharacterized protein n=1 Tax=Euplotes crassus TaxID=5936 RepID=A0AAD1XKB3_EUPCR|nr:unnamed protein product [Moneuplotes crassus]